MGEMVKKQEAKIFRKDEIKNAKNWFKDKLQNLSASHFNYNMSDLRYRGNVPLVGRMVYYKYHAKYEKTLPYWDMFPLVIMLDESAKHYYGLNLHYLPPKLRGVLLTKLMDTVNNDFMDKRTKLKITYNMLQAVSKYRFFKPCYKQYLKSNVKSKMMIIRMEQWPIAINLPVARFKGASASTVWADSKRSYS